MRLFLLTALTLIAFAGNSVLTRLALAHGDIGPWVFSLIRISAGAFILALIIARRYGVKNSLSYGSWGGAAALLIYAVCFSYAYLSLAAGTGALILFAVVQVTMIGAGLAMGERLTRLQWLGCMLAAGGLVYLLTPNIAAPSALGAILMTISGIGWGVYSLLGRARNGADGTALQQGGPTAQTMGNFVRAVGIIALLSIPVLTLSSEAMPAKRGVVLAVTSGAVTSGLGYALWYSVLKSLTAVRASIAQLSVPPLAALGGILFLGEPITQRFVIATLIILAGIVLATLLPLRSPALKNRPKP